MSISAMIYTTSMPPGGTRKSWITSAKPAGILPIWPQPWLTAIIPSNRSWPASWTGRRTISCTIGLCGPCARRISLPTPSSVRRRSAASAATAIVLFEGRYNPLQSFLATAYLPIPKAVCPIRSSWRKSPPSSPVKTKAILIRTRTCLSAWLCRTGFPWPGGQ